ncbi:putative F-box protein At1g53370 [Papaver somniferum]|uniref:putative F-box protein At1g53370 n=1 Tax=Papaver somniferum TaxID=3469 RepID=UPI000E701142|nr:putative F-box protein At1g53370 [Papaver somniferum]
MDHHDSSREVGGRGGIIRFTTTTPSDIGLQSSKLLELHRGAPYGLPRQTVNGLVSNTAAWDKESFVIYNPSNGETSPWIKTTAALEATEYYRPREVGCIPFGFDPTREEHKVICLSYPRKCNFPEFEVLTIDKNTWTGSGENIWRRLPDDVFSCASWEDALRSWLADPGVYVNGSIYRLLPGEGWEVIMLTEFDVLKEKLQYHSINGVDPLSTLQLMEFDGRVGILKRISDYEASVMICNNIDGMERYNWIEETISLPCACTVGMYQ